MIFYTPNGLIRPVRLSEKTRQFAYDSLNHKYGIETRKNSAVSLDEIDIKEYEKTPPLLRYDLAILKIAKEAPIRICEGERISGAATLGLAIDHQVPATYGGVKIFRSVSHLTVDFETVVKKGINHIRRQAEISLKRHRGSEKEPFLKSCMHCLNCFDIWHKRYLDALSDRPEYRVNYENLKRVPMEPAETFYEAVQSIWFTFAFLRLCGNWPGIGRIDLLLGDYLKNDLQKGILTLDEAREILAHFFIKGCEWIVGGEYVGGGDAQHYQNILLSGVDENGNDVTNEVTYLVLDILEELGISDFPTTVRLNKNTDEKLLLRVAEVMRYGGGILAVYNEDKVIEAMKKDGYSHAEASRFANDGCWEVQVPGKTFFMYLPFDSLHVLQKNTLNDYGADIDYLEMEQLARYIGKIEYAEAVRAKYENLKNIVNDVAYNGEYYVRAFSRFGTVGDRDAQNGGKIYVNPQSWSILSGICPAERSSSVLGAIDAMETDEGVPLCSPAYVAYDEAVGRMSGMLPGIYENGGIYNHAGCFKVMADCRIGRGENAVDTLLKILPDGKSNPSHVTTTEPYVFTNCYLKHPNCDMRVGTAWKTGTSAWGLMCCYEGILGLQRHYDGLHIQPVFPKHWKTVDATRNFRGNKLKLRYVNKGGSSVALKVDGKPIEGNVVPLFSDFGEHTVEVTLV